MGDVERGARIEAFSRSWILTLGMPAVVALGLVILFATTAMDAYYILALPILWGLARHLGARVVAYEKGLRVGTRFMPWSRIAEAELVEDQGDGRRLVLTLAGGARVSLGSELRRLEVLHSLALDRLQAERG